MISLLIRLSLVEEKLDDIEFPYDPYPYSNTFAFPLILVFCSCQKQETKIIILSKSSENYIKWMENNNTIILDAYTIKNTDSILALADGIILTGGEDINPLQYNDTINLAD